MNTPNVLDTPHITEPTAGEMLRKARDKYVPTTDAYMRAFLSELANKMDRIDKAEFVKPRHSGEAAHRKATTFKDILDDPRWKEFCYGQAELPHVCAFCKDPACPTCGTCGRRLENGCNADCFRTHPHYNHTARNPL